MTSNLRDAAKALADIVMRQCSGYTSGPGFEAAEKARALIATLSNCELAAAEKAHALIVAQLADAVTVPVVAWEYKETFVSDSVKVKYRLNYQNALVRQSDHLSVVSALQKQLRAVGEQYLALTDAMGYQSRTDRDQSPEEFAAALYAQVAELTTKNQV